MSMSLSGPHRTGKSTLAKLFAEENGFTFVQSNASQIFRDMGFSVDQNLTFDQRMTLQERIFDDHIDAIKAANNPWITDRSTLDFAVYLMAEWGKFAIGEDDNRLLAYVEKCINVASWTYPIMVMIDPGIPYVEEEGKPRPSKSFQEMYHRLLLGLFQHPNLIMPKWRLYTLDLDTRLKTLMKIWSAQPLAPDCGVLH